MATDTAVPAALRDDNHQWARRGWSLLGVTPARSTAYGWARRARPSRRYLCVTVHRYASGWYAVWTLSAPEPSAD